MGRRRLKENTSMFLCHGSRRLHDLSGRLIVSMCNRDRFILPGHCRIMRHRSRIWGKLAACGHVFVGTLLAKSSGEVKKW
jgi:hypothetical protein